MINLNILAYIIYGLITIYIIYFLGKSFHSNGRVFIFYLYNKNVAATDATNNMLLLLYYLLNMGYAIIQLYFWAYIHNWASLFHTIISKIGIILLLLACIHYINMLCIYYLSTKKKTSIHTN